MFRRVIWEVPEEYVADLVGNSVVEFPVGRKPIGTYDNVSEEHESFEIKHVHPIGFLGERLDHQFLILLSPFAHLHVRVDDGTDVLDNVLLLPSFFVKRYSTGRQRLYNRPDVDFRATGDTYMKVREGKIDKLLY